MVQYYSNRAIMKRRGQRNILCVLEYDPVIAFIYLTLKL